MVKVDLWHEIHSRFKLQETKKEIARALGLDVRTVRRLLRQEAPQPYDVKGHLIFTLSGHRKVTPLAMFRTLQPRAL